MMGRPTKDLRLALGILILQQLHDLTDPEVLEQVETRLKGDIRYLKGSICRQLSRVPKSPSVSVRPGRDTGDAIEGLPEIGIGNV